MSGSWKRTSGSGSFQVGVDCPASVRNLRIQGIGGGGGGAGAVHTGTLTYLGGGGGAGGYFEDVIPVTSASVIDWEVGEGGAGMSFGVFGQAGDGAFTIFGSAVAGYGAGGLCELTSTQGGAGGTASGTTVIIEGGPGGNGCLLSDDLFFECYTGIGGIGYFGGGSPASPTFRVRGAPGGGGGAHGSGVTSGLGMTGNAGMLIVSWYS